LTRLLSEKPPCAWIDETAHLMKITRKPSYRRRRVVCFSFQTSVPPPHRSGLGLIA